MKILVLAVSLALAAATSHAHAATSARAAATPTAANAAASPSTFSRGTPLPKWVQPLAEPPVTQRTDPVVMRVFETQALIGPSSATTISRAIQVNDAKALAVIGQFGIDYVPDYQTLQLHRVMILRGKERLDRTATVNVRHLQRETSIENGMYGGATTVQLLLDDVRPGDTLWIVYTTVGENPVFGNRSSDVFGWEHSIANELRRVTVLHPRNRPLYWQQLGDFKKERLVPVIDMVGDLERIRYEGKNVAEVEHEPSVPSAFFATRALTMSEYPDWSGVAQWADGLFPNLPSSPALKTLAHQFASETGPEAQASAALHWVQNEVRYFSVSMGENSHRPQPPDVVMKRRYGDCKDKSYLLVALLRELGINARPLLINADAPTVASKVGAAPTWFNHVIVQIHIGDRDYFVDPTRQSQPESITVMPPAFPGASVLPVDSKTTALLVLPARVVAEPQYELAERIVLPDLTGDGTLEVREIYRAEYADLGRMRFSSLKPSEVNKHVLELFEKQYPGVSLIGNPTLHDDIKTNQYEVHATLKLVKMLDVKEQIHSFEYETQILDGALGIPNKVVRNFPFALPSSDARRRFRIDVVWPEQLRARAPSTLRNIDSPYFRIDESFNVAANRVQVLIDYTQKQNEVSAEKLPELSKEAKKLLEYRGGKFSANANSADSPVRQKLSLRDIDSVDVLIDLQPLLKELDGKHAATQFAEQRCQVLRRAPDIREFFIAGMYSIVEEIDQNVDKATPLCQAQLALYRGQFARSAALFKSLPAQDGEAAPAALAWAQFYSGDLKGAVSTVAERQAARERASGSNIGTMELVADLGLLQRAAQPPPPELARLAASAPDGPWPMPLLAYQVGKLSEKDLLATIAAYSPAQHFLASSDAWFYIAQARLARQDTAGARQAYLNQRVLGKRSSAQYRLSQLELNRMADFDEATSKILEEVAAGRGKQVLPQIQAAAAQQKEWAQELLGRYYQYGYAVEKDEARARQLYALAAAHGNPDAEWALSGMLEQGLGGARDAAAATNWRQKAVAHHQGKALAAMGDASKDRKQAFDYYVASANAGFGNAMLEVAYNFRDGVGRPVDMDLYLFWTRRAVAKFVPAAMYEMGWAYQYGKGVDKNIKLAAQYYGWSAEYDYLPGIAQIGVMLDTGLGIATDKVKAIAFYRKGIELGSSDAMLYLGQSYADGDGVAHDDVKAVELFRAAAAKGNRKALNMLAYQYDVGKGVPQDFGEARKLYAQACERGLPEACYNMVIIYANGKGVAADDVQALAWLRKASDAGSIKGQLELGERYDRGNGVAKNPVKAAALWQLAADQGNTDAMVNLAVLYKNGDIPGKDAATALAMMKKAAALSNASACNNLGLMYQLGDGAPKDLVEAAKWYRAATDLGHLQGRVRLAQMMEMGWGTPKDVDGARRLMVDYERSWDMNVRYSVARYYRELGQLDRAQEVLGRALAAIETGDMNGQLYRSRMLAEQALLQRAQAARAAPR
ncbi:MAG: DUF3857 domain-containing protein [Massilia sp.]